MFAKQYALISTVAHNKRHKHQHKWVEIRNKVKALVSGEGYDSLLNNFAPREDEVLFEQRVRLTKKITKGISSRVLASFKRALRNDEITKVIEPSDSADVAEDYFKGKSIEAYTKEYIFPYSIYDPNALLIVDFKDFDNRSENADPYPFIVSSENILDIKEDETGDREYVIIQHNGKYIMYNAGEGNEDSKTYILTPTKKPANENLAFDFVEFEKDVKEGRSSLEREELNTGRIIKIHTKFFQLSVAEPNLEGKLQCFPLGYLLDMATDQESYISPLDPCIERLEAIATTASEMFLTKALHAFPQKIQRGIKCDGELDDDGHRHSCDGGMIHYHDDEGNEHSRVCSNCGGLGYKILPTTSAETLIVPLGEDKDDTLSLNDVAMYLPLDIEVMKFQDEYIKDQTEECLKDLFARSAFSNNLAEQTATETIINEESVDDVLYPFTQFFSEVYKWQVNMCASITDTNIERVVYDFPSTLRMRSRIEAIAELKGSEGAPYPVIQATREEIITKQFKDDPKERDKHLSRMRFSPFQGKTEDAISFLLTQSDVVTEEKKFLYANEEEVWMMVESQHPQFHEMEYTRQRELLSEVISTMIPERRTIPIPPDDAG